MRHLLLFLLCLTFAGCRTTPLEPGPRTVRFSGHAWEVKQSRDPVGPGPNVYSAHPESVRVDRHGRLYLRIESRSNTWHSAEVLSRDSFGYGRYTFILDSPVRNLDPNAVIGLFTWSDDPAQNHRELDVEITRWGDPEADAGQFVVQPYDGPDNLRRFAIPPFDRPLVFVIDWRQDRIRFEAAMETRPGKSEPATISRWEYRGPDIPMPGDEKVHINFWMNRGREPQTDEPMELVVREFRFEPRR